MWNAILATEETAARFDRDFDRMKQALDLLAYVADWRHDIVDTGYFPWVAAVEYAIRTPRVVGDPQQAYDRLVILSKGPRDMVTERIDAGYVRRDELLPVLLHEAQPDHLNLSDTTNRRMLRTVLERLPEGSSEIAGDLLRWTAWLSQQHENLSPQYLRSIWKTMMEYYDSLTFHQKDDFMTPEVIDLLDVLWNLREPLAGIDTGASFSAFILNAATESQGRTGDLFSLWRKQHPYDPVPQIIVDLFPLVAQSHPLRRRLLETLFQRNIPKQ